MKKVPKTVWVVVGLIVAGYAAWNIAYPSATWRYKTTVIVDTPEGEKTGSAVREVRATCEPKIFPEQASCSAIVAKGEAVVVDLGNRGVLFALMRENGGGIFDVFPYPDRFSGPLSPGGIRYYNSLKTGRAVLNPEHYPVLVHFKDIKDPKTAENVLDLERVDQGWPAHYMIKKDHMEEMFGREVKIKEVIIEMTDESPTDEIEKYLPWLSHTDGYISGEFASGSKLYEQLDSGDFERK